MLPAGKDIRAETGVCLVLLGRFQALGAVQQEIVIHEITHRAVPIRVRSFETRPHYLVLIQTPATLLARLRMEPEEDERAGALVERIGGWTQAQIIRLNEGSTEDISRHAS